MRKRLRIIMLVIMCVMLTGCGKTCAKWVKTGTDCSQKKGCEKKYCEQFLEPEGQTCVEWINN